MRRWSALLAFVPLAALAVPAPAPTIVVQTGRLLDGNDAPVSGMHQVKCSLFPDLRNGGASIETPLWTETYSVRFDMNGVYSVALGGAADDSGAGTKAPLSDDAFVPGQSRFLEMAVDGTTMSPRLVVGAAPFALAASDAARLGGHTPDYFATATETASRVAAVTAAAPLSVEGPDPTRPALSLARANAAADGYLAAADFRSFAGKAGKTGEAGYIQNGMLSQPNASFAIDGTGAIAGMLMVGGDVNAGSLTTSGALSAGSVTSPGDVRAANLTTNGLVSAGGLKAVGAVNAASFTGDGSALTNLPAANLSGKVADANVAGAAAWNAKVNRTGDAMTGGLTFSGVQTAISAPGAAIAVRNIVGTQGSPGNLDLMAGSPSGAIRFNKSDSSGVVGAVDNAGNASFSGALRVGGTVNGISVGTGAPAWVKLGTTAMTGAAFRAKYTTGTSDYGASECGSGWHVCAAQEWASRYWVAPNQFPGYAWVAGSDACCEAQRLTGLTIYGSAQWCPAGTQVSMHGGGKLICWPDNDAANYSLHVGCCSDPQ